MKCELPWCGHALSMHNELGYCRSRTTPDRNGECICDSTDEPSRRACSVRAALATEVKP